MSRSRLSLALAAGTLALGVSCGSGDVPPSSEMPPEVESDPADQEPGTRPPGPESKEQTMARLNQLPAYEDRTEPYPHTDYLRLIPEMFPVDIRQRYKEIFHVPIPEYATGLRGRFIIRESEPQRSSLLFNIPQAHLEDFRRHLIEDLGVPEKALTEQFHAGKHSVWERRDWDSRETERNKRLEETWAAADGGLRFLWSTMTQADHPNLPFAKGSPTLRFENHSNTETYPQMRVDLNSGQVIVYEKLVRPD